jgi:hypothetical protein
MTTIGKNLSVRFGRLSTSNRTCDPLVQRTCTLCEHPSLESKALIIQRVSGAITVEPTLSPAGTSAIASSSRSFDPWRARKKREPAPHRSGASFIVET